MSKFATIMIDNKYFQRLRYISQLGTCKYVYPNASHTRFEHSIGTYYLSKKLLKHLTYQSEEEIETFMSSIPELSEYYAKSYNGQKYPFDMYICELINISALCHDLGHGPFSHIFDDFILISPKLNENSCVTHEERSCKILRLIIKNNPILNELIGDGEIQFMINCINPQKHHVEFVYQIVSNNITSLDVDKFDYLQRDIYMTNFNSKVDVSVLIEQTKIINNNFVYSEQSINNIVNLFTTRHRLHSTLYCHKSTISIQLMIVEIFELLDDILNITESVNDMDQFINLTDEYILNSINIFDTYKHFFTELQQKNITKAKDLIDKIKSRQIYPLVYSIISKNKIDITNLFSHFDDNDDILCFQNKIGYVGGDKPNPLDCLHVYKTKYDNVSTLFKSHKLNKKQISGLISNTYQEYILKIYYKDKNNKKRINELEKYCNEIFESNSINELFESNCTNCIN
jgi:HD superfamily phosphohydrolase